MKLKLMRKHYTKKSNGIWVPKKSFNSELEIKEKLGYNPEECDIYTCTICNTLHIGTPTRIKNRNKIK